MKKSKLFSWNLKDLLKGFVVTLITAILTAVYVGIESGDFQLTWFYFKPIITTSLLAAVSYLLKNLLSNSEDRMFQKEPPKRYNETGHHENI